MATWCVYHVIHVRTPHQYLPRLVIRDVPEEEVITKGLLERAGHQFGEFGIPWANHVIEKVSPDTSETDLVYRLRTGEGAKISWDRLQKQASAPL